MGNFNFLKNKDGDLITDSNGNYRWIAWVTNRWIDREGEILTNASHKEFLAFLDKNPNLAPQLWLWHTPSTARKHQADWWDYANGSFVYSGVVEPDEMINASKALGMSHGFFVLEREGSLIKKYRTFEISVLPVAYAANPYTYFDIEKEINNMFNPEKRKFFLSLGVSEEELSRIEKGAEIMQEVLDAHGITSKQLNEKYQDFQSESTTEEPVQEEAAVEEEENKEPIKESDPVLDENDIVSKVIAALNLDALNSNLLEMNERINEALTFTKRLNILEEKVDHLLETDDVRLAKAFTQDSPYQWNFNRPTEVNEAQEVSTEIKAQAKSVGNDWIAGFAP